MFQAYTVVVQKKDIKYLNKQPYNIVNTAGYVTLEKTDYEHADDIVYYLLEDLDYIEVSRYQNNILIIAVNEIEDYNKKYIKQ